MTTKKYLLYIHHESFATEAHKSELVNKLLNAYYSPPPPQGVTITKTRELPLSGQEPRVYTSDPEPKKSVYTLPTSDNVKCVATDNWGA